MESYAGKDADACPSSSVMFIDDCIFCKIGAHQAEAKIEYEDEEWIVFHDIHPVAPVHVLLVPKDHFCWWDNLAKRQKVLGRLVEIAVRAAEGLGIKDSGFKLVMNGGKGAGQVIDHFHFHLIGGKGVVGPDTRVPM